MKCKQIVHFGNLGIIKRQCNRTSIKDEYCWQHHPDAVKMREEISEKRLAAKPIYLTLKTK